MTLHFMTPENHTLDHLIGRYATASRPKAGGGLLVFNAEGLDTYNISAPFMSEGVEYIAGRVEPRSDEAASQVWFFRFNKKKGEWQRDASTPIIDVQDPFVGRIQGKLFFGGVRVNVTTDGILQWRTVMWAGESLSSLGLVCVGPLGMKDIRLLDLADGSIGVFTRPQGEYGGLGKIGFTVIDDLSQLTPELLQEAPLVPQLFKDGHEWGGVNEPHLLSDGRIGILGHIAQRVEVNRQYCAFTCIFNPETREVSDVHLCAIRSDFPPTDAKFPDLHEVIFPGGLKFHDTGEVELFAGLSDTAAGNVRFPMPPGWQFQPA